MKNMHTISGGGLSPRSTWPTHTSPAGSERDTTPSRARASFKERFGAFSKSLKARMDFPPPNNDPILEEFQEMKQKGHRSLFNGFKLMSPYVQDAIQQTKEIFPRNFHDAQDPVRRKEQAVVFHERGKDRLVRGPIKIGNAGSVSRPDGLASKTARVKVH